jgi:hypothetical protein
MEETMTDLGSNSDRSALIAQIVMQFAQIETDKLATREDEKAVTVSCKEAELTKAEVAAIKRVAKLQVIGKLDAEREKNAAMRLVSKAVGVDLFAWADAQV